MWLCVCLLGRTATICLYVNEPLEEKAEPQLELAHTPAQSLELWLLPIRLHLFATLCFLCSAFNDPSPFSQESGLLTSSSSSSSSYMMDCVLSQSFTTRPSPSSPSSSHSIAQRTPSSLLLLRSTKNRRRAIFTHPRSGFCIRSTLQGEEEEGEAKERKNNHPRTHVFKTDFKASDFWSTIATVFTASPGKTTSRTGKRRSKEGMREESKVEEADGEIMELMSKSELGWGSKMKIKNVEEMPHWAQGLPLLLTRCSNTLSMESSKLPAQAEKALQASSESMAASGRVTEESWLTKLRFTTMREPWIVPWTLFTIIQVMFLWFCTFWLVGSWIIPFAAHNLGCNRDMLTYRGQALYSLITDIAEGTVGLGILHRCLARFQPLSKDWFPLTWRGQWYIDVLLGCLTFPLVNRLSQLNLELLPFPSPLTSFHEQSMMARDPIASILYAVVVSVCCPIWEEVLFRGFLLPSLTRYLPMWASIFVSAVVFGLAHFNVQRILPLTFLGLVMGIIFVRSRNLLSSMLLHSLWNGFIFLGLLR